MIGLLAAAAFQADAPVEWTALQQDNIQVAELAYDVGIDLAVICRDDQLIVAITGLPDPGPGAKFRKLEVNIPGAELQASTWRIHGKATISLAPAVYARRLRTADHLTVRAPAEEGEPARRYELALPSDHLALDQTLEACDVPLVSETDLAYDPTISAVTWATSPRITPPNRLPPGGYAEVVLECTVGARGRPENCRAIREEPADSGFVRAALLGIRTGRLGLIDGGQPPVGGVFRTRLTINVVN